MASIICPGGFKLPIYVHPIKSESVTNNERSSDDTHKQECELTAFKYIIREIRNRFPRLKLRILLDSLFATGPNLELLDELKLSYSIVRKDGSMPSVGDDCDGLLKLKSHASESKVTEKFIYGEFRKMERTYDFFNDIEYHGRKVNVIRFLEKIEYSKSGKKDSTYYEWIVPEKITKKNVIHISAKSRIRWEQEDQFNTAECRGFNMRHDYSRNSTAQMTWMAMINLAIAIEHIFIYTQSSSKLRKKMSIKDFMIDLFNELRICSKEKLSNGMSFLDNIQFRFNSIRKVISWVKVEILAPT